MLPGHSPPPDSIALQTGIFDRGVDHNDSEDYDSEAESYESSHADEYSDGREVNEDEMDDSRERPDGVSTHDETEDRNDEDEEDESCDSCRDVRRCFLVCRAWRVHLIDLLCLYAPAEAVLCQGSQYMAIRRLQRWLTASSDKIRLSDGEQDLLAISVDRGFDDCIKLLFDQVPLQKLRGHWMRYPVQARFYTHLAAVNGHVPTLQIMHDYDLSLDDGDSKGRTPFVIAVARGNALAAEYLLSIGANPKVTMLLFKRDLGHWEEIVSPMQYAAYSGTLEMVNVLVQHGLLATWEVDLDNGHNETSPLLWSLHRPDFKETTEISNILLRHSSDSELEEAGSHLLCEAIRVGASENFLHELVHRGVSVNPPVEQPYWSYPLDEALGYNATTIDFLIANGAKCTREAPITAWRRGDKMLANKLLPLTVDLTLPDYPLNNNAEFLQKCLEYGAEANPLTQDGRLLALAARQGDLDVCKVLVGAGADPNEPAGMEQTPLCNAFSSRNTELVIFLLQHGAKTSGQNGNALLAAVCTKERGLVEIALKYGGDVNCSSSSDETPLLMACSSRALDIAELLVASGADINARTGYYGSALHQAVFSGHLDVAEFLLKNNADVNNAISTHGTPLHLAADQGWVGMMSLLLGYGATVNALSGYHGRALLAAIASCSLPGVQLLIDAGADPNLQTGGYPTALDKATEYWEACRERKDRAEQFGDIIKAIQSHLQRDTGQADVRVEVG